MLTDKEIARLETLGFKRWTKGGHDRMYINATALGLECEYYHTGNIRKATFNGEEISNSEGRRLKAAKTFLDLRTDLVHSDSDRLHEAAVRLISEVIAAGGEEDEGCPSATGGDYGPSNPWDAPGMCVSDFITGVIYN